MCVAFVAAGAAMLAQAQSAPARAAQRARAAEDTQETVTRYCTGCHNDRARTAGLVLTPAKLGDDSAVGEKVVRKLRLRTMPPVGSPRPDEATYNRLTTWLEARLDQAAAANPKAKLATKSVFITEFPLLSALSAK